MLSAVELHERAVLRSRSGGHAGAVRLLDRAAARTDDPDLLARIDGTRAYVLAEIGDPAGSVEVCRTALTRPGLDPRVIGLLEGQLGLVEMRRGNATTAIERLTRALAAPLLPDERANVLNNRGMAYLGLRRLVDAEADFAEAHVTHTDAHQRAQSLHNQGYAAGQLGDLARALDLMLRARPDAATDAFGVAVTDQDRAEVLLYAGMPNEAVRLIASAATVFGARGARQMQAEAELTQARALLPGEPARALAVARRAARRFRARGATSWALRADTVAAQALVDVRRPTAATVAQLDRLADELTRAHLGEQAAVVRLTAARAQLHRHDPADAAARLALVRLPARASVPARLLAQEVRVEVRDGLGDHAGALADARRGIAVLRSWESRFDAPDLQGGLAMHAHGLIVTALTVAAATGRPDVMLGWSERARGLAATVVRPQVDMDAATVERLEAARTAEPAARRSLQHEVRERRWAGSPSAGPHTGAPIGLRALRAVLAAADACLLGYLHTRDRLHALVVDADGAWTTPLDASTELDQEFFARLRADLETSAAMRQGPIAAVVRNSLDARLATASRLLVDPVAHRLSRERIVLTVPGRLSGLPWSMLPGLTGRAVTVPTSATRWATQVATDWSTPRRRVLISGPDVPRGPEEVAAIAAGAPATVLDDGAATCAAVSAAAAGADLLHLVGHGHHEVENPLFSWLDLTDGPWWGHDIARLTPVPTVVVLSACDLGQGSVVWGDEELGMARAWLHAGARAVIAAPALVNDDDACTLLPVVHARLAAGDPPAVALAQASRLTGLSTPFVCYGAGW